MPFGMVSGVDRGIGLVIVEREGAVLGVNVGRPIVTNGDFVEKLSYSNAFFPNYFGRTCSVMVSCDDIIMTLNFATRQLLISMI